MNQIKHAGLLAGTILTSCALSIPAFAQDHSNHNMAASIHSEHNGHIHTSPAPISVMGDHMHKKGDWMMYYRFKHMTMKDNRNGTSDLSIADVIALSNVNTPPANLRVVPTQMSMNMHMISGMYGAADWLTLMVMGMYTEKDMDHVTFNGGGNQIGNFNTRSSGWGDTIIGGLIKLYENDTHHFHLNAALSLPTGDIDKEDDVLAPNGTTPTLRLPYAMQLGSGTYDLLPGLTYTGASGLWGWGGQYKATIRLDDENDEGYSWGNKHEMTAWSSYQFTPIWQGNMRVSAETMDEIDGADPLIAAPVQTADPDNYGGEIVEIGAGFNIVPTSGVLTGHQIGFEASAPVYQDLNGPQLKRDFAITGGWVYRF